LHPAQEDEEQLPQPGPPPEFEDLPMPNFERRFSVSFDPHFGQATSGFEPKTSFSKHSLQEAH
jgi:hypothetical protein